MTNAVKKNEFFLPFARLFTRVEKDAYDSIAFRSGESFGDEETLAAPLTWDAQAVSVMAEAACPALPADLYAIEENTVPSWLWRHQSRGTRRVTEGDVRDIINRAVGSAAAKAWKLALFSSEKHARAFYDEARYALMQRHIAITPDILAPWGLTWAYGIEENAPKHVASPHAPVTALTNAAIDSAVEHAHQAVAPALWKKLFAVRGSDVAKVTLRLSDVAADWHSDAPCPARAAIDVLSLRHNDGSVNIDALRQTTRLLVILLDLHDRNDVTIGIANLAPLLLALGLGYDSDAGRALAASLTALVTAECYATSAEVAALRGVSERFAAEREAIMRSLRNHRRAVYGDANDYEKLSVSPAALSLRNCPDLALLAEAQRRWDDVVERGRAFGLRRLHATDMTPSPALAVLMGSAAQGLEPMQRLTALQQDDSDHHRAVLHPAVAEALARLDYPRPVGLAAAQHIVGSYSLRKAQGINHAKLRACGLSEAVLEKIESYLPCVDSLRLAVTPWILGMDYCRTQLKISARTLESPRFDLLRHWGFSDTDVAEAQRHCYGHGTLRNAKILHLRHRPLFACGAEMSTEARLRMAAAVQGFVSGDTGMIATLPAAQSVKLGADITLAAWHSGLKSLTLVFDPMMTAKTNAKDSTTRRIKAASQAHGKAMTVPQGPVRRGTTAPILVKKSINGKRAAR